MNEQISALLDDEIAIEEAAHLIMSVQSQKAATLAWQQYHLIGDAMRGDALLSANFRQNLMQKLEAEPTVLAPNMHKSAATEVHELSQHASLIAQAKAGLSTAGLSARWSIAASFAAVMVVSYMALQNIDAPQSGITMAANDAATTTVAVAQTNNYADTDSVPLAYLMAHQAASPSASSYYMQTTSYSE